VGASPAAAIAAAGDVSIPLMGHQRS
jgi:hypothetical protein